MRKTVLLMVACMSFASVKAQFVVEENGSTAIRYNGTLPVISNLAINSRGVNEANVYINAPGRKAGLMIAKDTNYGDNVNAGGYITTNVGNGAYNYGLYSQSTSEATHSGTSCGVYGFAKGGANGRNFGVAGALGNQLNGAGLYGSSTENDLNLPLNGRYAGYFRGNINCTGSTTSLAYMNLSDNRLEDNIVCIYDETLNNILKMNVINYNYKQRELETDSGTVGLYDENSPVLNRKHYGLIAQELQELYPDLVVEDADGFFSINYVEIIPLLVRSIQELNSKIEKNDKSIAAREGSSTEVGVLKTMRTELFQNKPNPFTERTAIACNINESIKSATLYVYNMNGEQLAQYPLAGRGNTEVIIEGRSLEAGMYLYSLIADGDVIDTKRMILTK